MPSSTSFIFIMWLSILQWCVSGKKEYLVSIVCFSRNLWNNYWLSCWEANSDLQVPYHVVTFFPEGNQVYFFFCGIKNGKNEVLVGSWPTCLWGRYNGELHVRYCGNFTFSSRPVRWIWKFWFHTSFECPGQ